MITIIQLVCKCEYTCVYIEFKFVFALTTNFTTGDIKTTNGKEKIVVAYENKNNYC